MPFVWISTTTGVSAVVKASGSAKEPEGLGSNGIPSTVNTRTEAGGNNVDCGAGEPRKAVGFSLPTNECSKASSRITPSEPVGKVVAC